jgi:Domain of unknown function (DUF4062)
MEKRYQVFVSSTFSDLEKERDQVFRTLMEMDCFPAGMEFFPAIDNDQFEFIKKVIDDCDYYLLIIGGRYGTVSDEGISYTEKEFDYAVSKNIKVVALIHGSPDSIPAGKSELNPDLREKLSKFRNKVKTGRLVKFWEKTSDIPGLVALNMNSTIKSYPAVGWVRASQASSQEILSEINELRKEREQLIGEMIVLRTEVEVSKKDVIEGIADIDSVFTLSISYKWAQPQNGRPGPSHEYTTDIDATWREMFSAIAPFLIETPAENTVNRKLAGAIFSKEKNRHGTTTTINEQQFKTIGIQLTAYGLVEIKFQKSTSGTMYLYWYPTPKGDRLMMEERVIRAAPIAT